VSGFPLITIIMVILNSQDKIERVIDEVHRQTYPQKELIIIDGGSTDGTVEVLKRKSGDITFWLSEADGGIYDAFNKGIDAAKGEWIFFLGADDTFSRQDILERVMSRNIPDDAVLLVGNVLYADGRPFSGRFNEALYVHNTVHHQGVFYRRRVFDSYRYGHLPSGKCLQFQVSGDYALNLKLFCEKAKCLYIDEIIACCGRGLSMEGRWQGYAEEIFIRRQFLGYRSLPFDALTLLRFGRRRLGYLMKNIFNRR
jgi:putative colanic acid biosynthesis glycosyltransferase